MRTSLIVVSAVTLGVVATACTGDKKKNVTDTDSVIAVYTNFQPTIMKIMSAGIAAKGTASQGANIPPIQLVGAVVGTGGIGGSVAQSGGQNENLNLWVELDGYSDTGDIVFQTDNTNDSTKLQFDLNIQNQPTDNTMNGDLVGLLTLSGDIEGTGTFDLHFVSDLDDDNNNPFLICTRVTGTVSAATESSALDFVLVHTTMSLGSAQQAKCETL